LKCLSEKSIERIEEGVRSFSEEMINEKPMFCYSGFLRELVVDSKFDIGINNILKKIGKGRRNYLQLQDEYDEYSREFDVISEELVKLLCENSNRIHSLSITPCKMIDYMIPLLKGDHNHFQRIKKFTFNGIFNRNNLFRDDGLILALSRASRDIAHIRIKNVDNQGLCDSLVTLLNSQNRLRSLDLECHDLQNVSYYETMLSSSPHSTNSLSFDSIYFCDATVESTNCLAELSRKLKGFKLIECVDCSLLCNIMKSWENLVEFTYHTNKFDKDLEFLLTMLKLTSKSLRYLDIFWIREDDNFLLDKSRLIKCITENCTQLTSLKLRRLNCEDLFPLWYSCKKLEVFSFLCCEKGDWEERLEDLGRVLPCSVKVLKIGNWISLPFSAVALEGFLKGCKKSLKKFEIYSFVKTIEYIKVLNDSGVYYELL